jgi:hypothetical protein
MRPGRAAACSSTWPTPAWRDCAPVNTHGVRFVIRLKDNWKPKVDYIARGRVNPEFFPGTDLDVLLEEDILVLDGRAIDADVHVRGANNPLHLRLVGIHTPKGYCFFLTNLPPRIGPRQVGDLYRIRWEVELSIRLDKSVHRLDQVDAERPCSVKTLLHASLLASLIAALLAHTHNQQTHPRQEGAPRTEAPLHPRRLALQLAVSCQSIAQAFDLQGTRPSTAGSRSQTCSPTRVGTPTGVVGRRSWISSAAGSANRSRKNNPAAPI